MKNIKIPRAETLMKQPHMKNSDTKRGEKSHEPINSD